jgi:hypothetical protein
MKRNIGCLLVTIFCLFVSNGIYGIEPYNERRNDFEADIIFSVSNTADSIIYKYKILYHPENKRELVSISFSYHPDFQVPELGEFAVRGKADRDINWVGGRVSRGTRRRSMYIDPFKGNHPLKETIIPPRLVFQTSEAYLKPGETLVLEIESRSEHTIVGVAELNGFCNAAKWIWENAEDAPPDFDTGNYPKTFTVPGPVPKPQNQTSMIDHLIATTTGAYNEGWISKADVYQGLMDKLAAAKENILKGRRNYHTARNIIGAFKHLLDAQRGKAIDEACYQMLYINADEMIKMLGG